MNASPQSLSLTRFFWPKTKFAPEATTPVFHATDSYEKHRKKLDQYYKAKFPEEFLLAESTTPKGDASGRVISVPGKSDVKICGEPMHNLFRLRRLVKPQACDSQTFLRDHQDLLARLSARPLPADDVPELDDQMLSGEACQLLVKCITGSWQKALRDNTGAREELKQFVQKPQVRDHRVWLTLFAARPPRGTIARLARRMGVQVHWTEWFYSYPSKEDLLAELDALQSWYKPGRKKRRLFNGIIRSENQKKHVRGLKTAWSASVQKHFDAFRREVHLEGLLAWQECAQELWAAGMTPHSGTIPCERLWSLMQGMIPVAARRITPQWFRWIANISFLRCVILNARNGSICPWTRGDILLAQRLSVLSEDISKILDEIGRGTAGEDDLADILADDIKLGQALQESLR